MKRRFIIGLMAMIVVTTTFLFWLITTESGLDWSYQQVRPHLPQTLSVSGLSGRLVGPLAVQEIKYQHQGQILNARQVRLSWNPWRLLQAEIDVSDLHIQSLDIVIAEGTGTDDTDDQPISLPQIKLPLGLRLTNAEISSISISRGSDNYKIDQIKADAVAHTDGLVVKSLDIDSEKLSLSLQGSLNPVADYPHEIKLWWKAMLPSGKYIESEGEMKGNMRSTRITQSIIGALQLNLAFELRDLLSQPTWHSELDVRALDTALIDTRLPTLKANLKVTASGDTKSARISGRLQAETAELGAISADFRLSSLDGIRRFDGINFDMLEISALQGQLSANGQLNWSPLHWQADVSASRINPATILPQWPGDIEAHFSTSGQIENGALIASADISRLRGILRDYPVSLQSQLQWKDNGVDISQLNLSSGNTRLSAGGRVSETLNLHWSLDSDNLAELYPRAQGSLKANGELGGSRESPTLQASFDGKSLRLPGYELDTLRGNLTLDLLKPEQLNLELTSQGLMLQGHALQSLDVIADLNRISTTMIAAEANAQITLTGTLEDDHWRGKLVQADIQTDDYLNWKLKAPTAVNLSRNSLLTDKVCLLSDHDSEICGRIEGMEELWKFGLDFSRLPLYLFARWIPPDFHIEGLADASASLEYRLPGQLQGKVELDLAQGVVTYTLANKNTEQFDYRFGQLEIQLQPTDIKARSTLELVNGDRLEVRIVLPGADILSLNLESQNLQARVRLNAHELGIFNAMTEEVGELQGSLEADLDISGTLANPRVKGTAQLLDVGLSIPAIKLRLKQLNLNARSDDHEKISYQGEVKLASGQLRMRGDTKLNAAEGWPSQIRLEGESINLAELLEPWLPSETKIEGLLSTTATLNYTAPDILRGEIELSSQSGTLSYPLLEGEIEHWDYRDSGLNLILDQQGIRAHSKISIGAGNTLVGNLNLPRARLLTLDRDKQVFEAKARLIFNELAIIEALVPDIDKLRGSLTLGLDVDGTLAEPNLAVSAEILDAAVAIPRLGLSIDKVSLRGTTDNDKKFNFLLEAHSGGGTLAIGGASRLDATSGWPTTFTIKGDDFEVAKIPEATISISPDLLVELQGRSIDVHGDLLIPHARLQPKDITTAAQVSNDAVIIDSTEKTESRWQITTRINLILGDRVSFFGFGFEGDLAGNLLIQEGVDQLARGIGEIKIPRGRYRAYGQRLDIENGRLLFTGGPLTNPGLDIRAVRKTGSVTAGIQARGRLKQPRLELFSAPAMGQADTLSYLLLGRPMETASGEDGAMMAQAALALGLSGGDQLARTIGDQFGLDEMRVESNDTGDQASLVVGRYLSPQLYVSYGAALVGSFNTLNLRYMLSEKWQLKANSGAAHGADLMYTFER